MSKIKDFIKKYHLIPYVIIILSIAVLGYCVKWYNFNNVMTVLDGNVSAFYGYFNIIFIIILIGVSVVYFFTIIKKANIEKIYVISAIFVGIVFMLIIPPHASADEDRHILKAYDFSNFFWGYSMPEEKYHWLRECDSTTGLSRDISIRNYAYVAENFFKRADKVEMRLEYYDDITYDNSNIIYYFPATIGITIGRILGLGTIATYTLARIFMLASYIVLTYFALKKIPTFKTGFALIMLLPSSVQRAASVSYDVLQMAYIFVFVAYVFYYIYNKAVIKAKDAVIMAVTGVLMAVGKGGAYVPFLLMLFLIPKAAFGRRIKYGFIVAGAILVSLMAYVAFNWELFSDIVSSTNGETNDLLWTEEKGYTLKDVITMPKNSLKILVNTFISLGGVKYAEMLCSGFGWLQIYVSEIWIAAFSILLTLSVFREEDESFVFSVRQKVMLGIIAVASAGLIILSMWIFWTPLSSIHVQGIQGRYFIVILIPLIFLLKNKLFTIRKKMAPYMICAAVVMYAGLFFDIWSRIKL